MMMDDFTIALPQWINLVACELEMYRGLDHLWRMVDRYKMTAPIAIRVLHGRAGCVRTILADRNQTTSWQLKDETTAAERSSGGKIELPVTLELKDAKGNILKIRLELGS
jgi:hypothetical protein